ncbi:MAG TPA: lysylphosphatidylglycerol synthase domain-containing protein [Aliidongia sp.]|nr:lysylphosphatidylglycerol synthase domain-containing protein [Aliidongia sp.]
MGLIARIDWRRWISILTIVIVVAALAIVVQVLHQFTLEQIWRSFRRIGPRALGLAALCTAASYLSLTCFDRIGVAYAKAKLPYRRVALAAFVSLSIGHTVGLAPFSSGAIRYRYYSSWGLDVRQIGLIVMLSAVTVAMGELTLSAVALLAQPELVDRVLKTSRLFGLSLGAAAAALVLAYVVLNLVRRRPFKLGRWSVALPGGRLAAAQIGVGLVNYLLVAGALHFLLSAVTPVDYFTTATAFVLGNLAALVTHVPGGLGVLEAVIVTLLPQAEIIGPLIAFRIVYFLAPLCLGSLVFATTAWRR